jgi:hypothetical protein
LKKKSEWKNLIDVEQIMEKNFKEQINNNTKQIHNNDFSTPISFSISFLFNLIFRFPSILLKTLKNNN